VLATLAAAVIMAGVWWAMAAARGGASGTDEPYYGAADLVDVTDVAVLGTVESVARTDERELPERVATVQVEGTALGTLDGATVRIFFPDTSGPSNAKVTTGARVVVLTELMDDGSSVPVNTTQSVLVVDGSAVTRDPDVPLADDVLESLGLAWSS